jgi:hypothetical protein
MNKEDKMNILYDVVIIGEPTGISEMYGHLLSRQRINSFFILSGYYFSTQSSVYLFTIQGMFFIPKIVEQLKKSNSKLMKFQKSPSKMMKLNRKPVDAKRA